jgi:hypothetical protein
VYPFSVFVPVGGLIEDAPIFAIGIYEKMIGMGIIAGLRTSRTPSNEFAGLRPELF